MKKFFSAMIGLNGAGQTVESFYPSMHSWVAAVLAWCALTIVIGWGYYLLLPRGTTWIKDAAKKRSVILYLFCVLILVWATCSYVELWRHPQGTHLPWVLLAALGFIIFPSIPRTVEREADTK